MHGLDLGDEVKIKTALFLTTVLGASKIPLPSQTETALNSQQKYL